MTFKNTITMNKEKDSYIIAQMEPMLTKKFADLADEIERTVPTTGTFEDKFAVFEDETKSLKIDKWSVTIYEYAPEDTIHERCLDMVLVGYTGGISCITSLVGSGSIKKCTDLLRSHDFVVEVMRGMKNLIEKYEHIELY